MHVKMTFHAVEGQPAIGRVLIIRMTTQFMWIVVMQITKTLLDSPLQGPAVNKCHNTAFCLTND